MRVPFTDPDGLCDHVLATQLRSGSPASDDVTVLAVQPWPLPADPSGPPLQVGSLSEAS
jgi:hypothetical protein